MRLLTVASLLVLVIVASSLSVTESADATCQFTSPAGHTFDYSAVDEEFVFICASCVCCVRFLVRVRV
jgi:hypothetical protein